MHGARSAGCRHFIPPVDPEREYLQFVGKFRQRSAEISASDHAKRARWIFNP